ncbi:hypothetical protein MO867_12045 [Microbulbifer sp. OS29]|uniref:Uncharacterized protein n=1 Tax=Microbulbifer okhotskensis TaxID=2926617 RepID=A0A9X2ENQ7_9GAMM|nr:hypothetical protein [Microbulbifer okhotskensis]MCO1335066.1 hypothetical protein [Microbulbifer okhotskensis]
MIANLTYLLIPIIAFIFIYLMRPGALGKAVDRQKSTDYYFNKWNTRIYYSPSGNSFSLGKNHLRGVDISTFQVLGLNKAKDADHNYFEHYCHFQGVFFYSLTRTNIYRMCWYDPLSRRCLPLFIFRTLNQITVLDANTIKNGRNIYEFEPKLGFFKKQIVTEQSAEKEYNLGE